MLMKLTRWKSGKNTLYQEYPTSELWPTTGCGLFRIGLCGWMARIYTNAAQVARAAGRQTLTHVHTSLPLAQVELHACALVHHLCKGCVHTPACHSHWPSSPLPFRSRSAEPQNLGTFCIIGKISNEQKQQCLSISYLCFSSLDSWSISTPAFCSTLRLVPPLFFYSTICWRS